MGKDVIIIGGGLGGLVSGAFLAKEGFRVLVLEKNKTIGGGLQCFKYKNTIFETGMHILGGFYPGGNLHKICSYLGIMDKMDIRQTDMDAMDSITYAEDHQTFILPRGKDAFTRYLQMKFPEEHNNIQRYMDAMYRISEEVDLFYLRSSDNSIFSHSDEFLMPIDEFIAKYVHDERLRDILAYMNPMYGGIAGHTPVFIHAMINVLYIEGSSQFVDGSQQMADRLADIIMANGGEIHSGSPVVKIEVLNKQVVSVLTKDGTKYTADWYITLIPQHYNLTLFISS